MLEISILNPFLPLPCCRRSSAKGAARTIAELDVLRQQRAAELDDSDEYADNFYGDDVDGEVFYDPDDGTNYDSARPSGRSSPAVDGLFAETASPRGGAGPLEALSSGAPDALQSVDDFAEALLGFQEVIAARTASSSTGGASSSGAIEDAGAGPAAGRRRRSADGAGPAARNAPVAAAAPAAPATRLDREPQRAAVARQRPLGRGAPAAPTSPLAAAEGEASRERRQRRRMPRASFVVPGADGLPARRVWPVVSQKWFNEPQYADAQALHDELMRRAQAGAVADVGALYGLMQIAASREDAQLMLNALEAVRAGALRRGQRQGFPPKLVRRFVSACAACEAPDVLLAAMYRANELGLLMSANAADWALKHFAARHDADSVERLLRALSAAGVAVDHRSAYCVIRMFVAMGLPAKARAYEAEFRERGVRLKPTVERLLVQATPNPEAAFLH